MCCDSEKVTHNGEIYTLVPVADCNCRSWPVAVIFNVGHRLDFPDQHDVDVSKANQSTAHVAIRQWHFRGLDRQSCSHVSPPWFKAV